MSDDLLAYGPDASKDGGDLSFMTMLFALDDELLAPFKDRFDETMLAAVLRSHALDCDDVWLLRSAIFEIANALDHPKAGQRLKLAKHGRGRKLTAAQREIARDRDSAVVSTVWQHFSSHGQLEAAVAEATFLHKTSRTTVFKALRKQANIYRSSADIFGRLPDTSRKWSTAEHAAYSKFVNWLDRFSTASTK